MRIPVFLWTLFCMSLCLHPGCRSSQAITWQAVSPGSPLPQRYVGPDFWPNDLGDWYREGNSLVCQSAKPQRSLVLLTQSIDADSGRLWASVQAQLQLSPDQRQPQNFVGFRIGGEGTDAGRVAPFTQQGLSLGLTHTGELFIGDPATAESISPLDMDIPWELRLHIEEQGAFHKLTLAAYELSTNRLMERVVADSLPSSSLRGMMALLSHVETEIDTPQKGIVHFQNWRVAGNRLQAHPERAWGPILFTRHSLDRERLTLAAYLAPITAAYTGVVSLALDRGNGWELIKESSISSLGHVARFSVPEWTADQPVPYRLSCRFPTDTGFQTQVFADTLFPTPGPQSPLSLGICGPGAGEAYPATDLSQSLAAAGVDWLIQPAPTPAMTTSHKPLSPESAEVLGYLHRWHRLGWLFGPTWQQHPSLVYAAANSLGALEPWVQALIQAPDPVPAATKEGLKSWSHSSLDLAWLDDESLLSSPSDEVESTLRSLGEWCHNWRSPNSLKVLLSRHFWAQSPDLSPQPGLTRGSSLLLPASKTYRAIERLRQGRVLQLVSPSSTHHLQQYTLATARDASFAFRPSSLHVSAEAAEKPAWALIRLDPLLRSYTLSQYALPTTGEDSPLMMEPAWPFVIHQSDQDGRKPSGWLPPLSVSSESLPVITLTDEATQTLLYAYRLPHRELILPVYGKGPFRMRLQDPATGQQKTLLLRDVMQQQGQGDQIRVELNPN